MSNIIIRRERKDEEYEVEKLIRASFWNVYRPGALEHYVMHLLRSSEGFVEDLDLVIEKDGELIGQIAFYETVLYKDDGTLLPILTMGPIAIKNRYKRKGYGKRLLDYALSKAEAIGYGAVCFEGNIGFYGKCGFVYASEFNIRYHGLRPDADASFFLAKELSCGYLSGISAEYRTPEIYLVDEKDAETYDSEFPESEKLKLPAQIF